MRCSREQAARSFQELVSLALASTLTHRQDGHNSALGFLTLNKPKGGHDDENDDEC